MFLLSWIKLLCVRKKMSGAQTMCSASITQTVGTLRGQQMQEPCKEIEYFFVSYQNTPRTDQQV